MNPELIEGLFKLGAVGILSAVLVSVVKTYYGDLKTQMAQMVAKITLLETRCDKLEEINAGLVSDKAVLTHQLTSCPALECPHRRAPWQLKTS